MNQTPASARKPRTARVLMFDVSLPWANFWYDTFNVMLFVGAFAVAVGTYGTIKMGAVRDKFSDERTTVLESQTAQANAALGEAQADIARANVKIADANKQAASLEKDTARARQAIVEANAHAAEANARALEAQAALEKFKAPRYLDDSQIERFKTAVAKFAGTPFDIMVTLESEPQRFAGQIGGLLESVGWIWKDRNNTPGLAINIGKHQAGMFGEAIPLAIEIDASKEKDWLAAAVALGDAFLVESLEPRRNIANDGSASPDAVHLYFGSKR